MWLIMFEISSTCDKNQGVFVPSERPRICPKSVVIFPISTSPILCTVSSGYFQKRNASRFVLTSYLKPVHRFRRDFQWSGKYTPISKNVVGENDECQSSNGNCTTEKKCGYWILIGNNIFRDAGSVQCRASMASHMVCPHFSEFSGRDFIFLRRLWKDSGTLYF